LIKIKKTNEVETKLGRSYTIQSNYSKAVSTNILLEFEELDDNTLRFKISNKDEKDYEVPIEINKPFEMKPKNPRYEYQVDDSNDQCYH